MCVTVYKQLQLTTVLLLPEGSGKNDILHAPLHLCPGQLPVWLVWCSGSPPFFLSYVRVVASHQPRQVLPPPCEPQRCPYSSPPVPLTSFRVIASRRPGNKVSSLWHSSSAMASFLRSYS